MTKRSLVDDMTKQVSGPQVPAALMHDSDPVSYTHLTLPTIYSV